MRATKSVGLKLAVVVGLLLSLSLWWVHARAVYFQGHPLRTWTLQLGDPNPKQRQRAEAALHSLGSRAVPGLIRLLQARDPVWRRLGWRLASRLPPAWQPAVVRRAGALEAYVTRERAARALGLLGPAAQPAEKALVEAFGDPATRVAWQAAEALAQISGPAALPRVLDALDGPNWAARPVAAYAIGNIGPGARRAIPALAQALADRRTSSMAIFALGHIGPDAAPAMIEVSARGGDRARAGAVRVLTGLLRGAGPPPQPGAPDAAAVSADEILKALIKALHDPFFEVRVEAAAGLALSGRAAEGATSALIGCLRDPSVEVRTAAVGALAALGPPARAAAPELQRLAQEKQEDLSVRRAAREALNRVQR